MIIKYWKPPKIWNEATVAILGGGPSLNSIDLNSIPESFHVIAVNNSYGYSNRKQISSDYASYSCRSSIDLVWFGDRDWFYLHQYSLVNFPGIVASCAVEYLGVPWVNMMQRGKYFGIDERPGSIAWNGNSGGSAINLAWHLGASKIVLLGFDMRTIDGKNNYHDHHKIKRTAGYSRFLKSFDSIASDASKLGLSIVNATLGSSLEVFPIVDPLTILERQNEQQESLKQDCIDHRMC